MKYLFFGLLFIAGNLLGQSEDRMPYVSGEVLVIVDDNTNIGKVIHNNAHVDGIATELETVKLVSKPVNVWLLSFNPNAVSHADLLKKLLGDPYIKLAQNNHLVQDRATTPNDGNFAQQWHHVNANDSDIDSDLAWDYTTGGQTAIGDEIVVCVLEAGGADWDHPDLIDNHWVNSNEIPNNNIDDDNNGYVDDYNGWNEPAGNDVISAGSHGTQVSGMIGATGNNNLLVAGANWDVKIMQVQNGNINNEANVVAAYTYPLVMRQKYEASNGTEGAFVVATNASWGIDQGDPNSAPIWCAFYDTLGEYGILNCGATTNSSLNVDAVGDLPTACPSDFMISVTRTGNTDQQGGGYGLTTIDLGAPGISVVTTANGGGSGSTTGTSFSSPLTAGVIALLYSAPCASLAALAHANPKQAALDVRSALLNGTDPVNSLSGITVTGGRLNAHESILEILNACSSASCLQPWQLAASNVTNIQADLSWGGTGNSYNIRYRMVGSPTWFTTTSISSNISLTGLTGCSDYEVQVQAVCGGATDTSAHGPVLTFKTDGCCEAPNMVNYGNVMQTSVEVNWNSVLIATGYNLRYKLVGATTWTTINNVTSPFVLTGLNACADYELEVNSICSGTTTPFSQTIPFSTSGCGACLDMNYCASEGGDTSDEWIEQFELGTLSNTSGDDGGYADFSGMSADVEQGVSYAFTITPGYSGFTFQEYYKIWIDFNHDGDLLEARITVLFLIQYQFLLTQL